MHVRSLDEKGVPCVGQAVVPVTRTSAAYCSNPTRPGQCQVESQDRRNEATQVKISQAVVSFLCLHSAGLCTSNPVLTDLGRLNCNDIGLVGSVA